METGKELTRFYLESYFLISTDVFKVSLKEVFPVLEKNPYLLLVCLDILVSVDWKFQLLNYKFPRWRVNLNIIKYNKRRVSSVMGDRFVNSKEILWKLQIDANILHGWAMKQKLFYKDVIFRRYRTLKYSWNRCLYRSRLLCQKRLWNSKGKSNKGENNSFLSSKREN